MSATDTTLVVPPDTVRRGLAPPVGRQIWHEDARGRRQGSALRWHPSGDSPRILTDYVDGQRQGRHRIWYPSGALELEGQYLADEEEGIWRRYGEDGTLLIEVPCVQGLPEGPCRSFYPNGALARAWVARQGLEEGTATVYLPDGQLFSEETLRSGLREGPRRVWLAGQLLLEDHWRAGVLEGPFRTWGWGGILLEEGEYQGGQRQGRWRFLDYTGAVRTEGDYHQGVPAGDWTPPPSLTIPLPEDPGSATAPLASLARGAGRGPVPATLITGFLGAGKTTAVLHLLAARPPGERWVVYVNEFGEVGVDGALIPTSSAGEGLFVRELAGGCACCSSNLPFVEGIAAVLEQLQPDHLLIEPTGLADAEALRDSLLARLGERLELRATLCLIDPRRLRDPRYAAQPTFSAQVRACDVLIANRCDLAAPEDMAAFRHLAADVGPHKRAILETEQGRIDLDWLAHTPILPATHHQHHHHHHSAHMADTAAQGRGFLLGEAPFSRAPLEAVLSVLLVDAALFPLGWLRLKGVLALEGEGWWVLNADLRPEAGGVTFDWRPAVAGVEGESRLECLAPTGAPVDWESFRTRLVAARITQ